MRRALLLSVLFALIIAACGSAFTAQPAIMVERPTSTPRAKKPTPAVTPPKPVEKAVIKQLAANLGLKESDISIVRSEETEFGDACLGVAISDMLCAEMVVPGHLIVLEARGIQYEYHTSADGKRIQPATIAFTWKREGGIAGFCDYLTVFRSGEVYSQRCNGNFDGRMGTFAKLLSAREQKQFSNWMAAFGETLTGIADPEGVADRMVISLQFYGSGTKQPTEAEQQAMLEFAQNLYQKLGR